jgi:predicted small secreted protein
MGRFRGPASAPIVTLRNRARAKPFGLQFVQGVYQMRKLLILFAAMTALSVTACNTVAGAGQDVSAAGHAVTHTADDAKP